MNAEYLCRGFGENVGGCSRVPLGTLAAERCRPHQIQNRREVDHYVNGVTTLHGVGEQDGLLVEGNEEPLANDEVGAYVGAGDGFGVIGNATKQDGAGGFGCIAGRRETPVRIR